MRIFVLLPRELSATQWHQQYVDGKVPDESPYGYHHAQQLACEVIFSQASPRTGFSRLIDAFANRIFGFDVSHVWRNRRGLLDENIDVVWTHTERENLPAIALQSMAFWRSNAPKIISQIVWLMDSWSSLPAHKRWLSKILLNKADVLTFHSESNARMASGLQLAKNIEVVPFGISEDSFGRRAPKPRKAHASGDTTVRILALGNDRHRDWKTLASAFGDQAGFEVRVGSATFPESLKANNFTVKKMSQKELVASYDWCDCVVVPLIHNLHASGLTVLLEATSMGVPVVVSNTGGLDGYFSSDSVSFVPVGDAEALRTAAQNLLLGAPEDMVRAAQANIDRKQLTSRGYAYRHVELSKRLLRLA